MSSRSRIALGLVALGVGVLTASGPVRAGDHEDLKLIHTPKHVRSNVATPQTMHRAGHPQEVSPFLSGPAYNEHYSGSYVGGGKAGGHGHDRCLNEGTWGWDYTPFRPMSSFLFLNRSHGRHDQGGTGSYATDAPPPLERLGPRN